MTEGPKPLTRRQQAILKLLEEQQPKLTVRRAVLGFVGMIMGIIVLAFLAFLVWAREWSNAVPPVRIVHEPGSVLHYPYELVPGDRRLDFPAAEGRQRDMDSDTWFLEGFLQGQESGRRFAFITVFFFSRIYGFLPFNFYSLTLYDLDQATYGTFTRYDIGEMLASSGYLDLAQPLDYRKASWTTEIDPDGYLVPYSYLIDFFGDDQHGEKMRLEAQVQIVNPPVAVGADVYNGRINVLKQEDTYSYFQTGVQIRGELRWGDHKEIVEGHLGHMDRQMFPKFSGAHNSRDGRDLSHEWRTFFLDNGMDFSSWRQFDRTNRNAEYAYGGATVYDRENGARYASDIVYENLSYVRTENHPIKPLVPARADVLYFPNRHRISSHSLALELQVDPIVHAPLLAFPVEYMHGPVRISGTQGGERVSGLGSFEMTLHLYRDFELVQVLSDSVRHLPTTAIPANAVPRETILETIERVAVAVDREDLRSARSIADGSLREQLRTLSEPFSANMLQILDDLVGVLQ